MKGNKESRVKLTINWPNFWLILVYSPFIQIGHK